MRINANQIKKIKCENNMITITMKTENDDILIRPEEIKEELVSIENIRVPEIGGSYQAIDSIIYDDKAYFLCVPEDDFLWKEIEEEIDDKNKNKYKNILENKDEEEDEDDEDDDEIIIIDQNLLFFEGIHNFEELVDSLEFCYSFFL